MGYQCETLLMSSMWFKFWWTTIMKPSVTESSPLLVHPIAHSFNNLTWEQLSIIKSSDKFS
jgi:hypothetical protein